MPELGLSVFEVPRRAVKGCQHARVLVCDSVAQSIIESVRGEHPDFVFRLQRAPEEEQAGTDRDDEQQVTPQDVADWIGRWDPGPTVGEKRAALAQLVEWVEFDPASGAGRVHYLVHWAQVSRFDLRAAAAELGLPARGACVASPRGFDMRTPQSLI